MATRTPSSNHELRQMSELQLRLAEAEDTLNAIRSGAVDALVVRTPRGEQLFTLKGADQTYRILVEAMNEGAVTLKRGIISFCNNHFARMVRTPLEKVFGASLLDFVESSPAFWSLLRQLQTGKASRGSMEGVLCAGNGAKVPVLLAANRFFSEGEAAICLIVMDISERKAAERARQELSRQIINAQEQERQRVARDLHDSVNQLLSSAKYRLGSMAAKKGARHAPVIQAHELIEKAINEVRLISRNLRPSELDDLGLVAALRTLAHDFQKRTRIRAQLKAEATSGSLSREGNMTLYRIAQEALNNVEKHSGAKKVTITLTHSRAEIRLIVRDNGKGFRPSSNGKSGWGLQNMNERATLLGGVFEASSFPGRGTTISVRIPLHGENRTKNGS